MRILRIRIPNTATQVTQKHVPANFRILARNLVGAGGRGPGVLHIHPHVLRQVVDVRLEGLQDVKVVPFDLREKKILHVSVNN